MAEVNSNERLIESPWNRYFLKSGRFIYIRGYQGIGNIDVKELRKDVCTIRTTICITGSDNADLETRLSFYIHQIIHERCICGIFE